VPVWIFGVLLTVFSVPAFQVEHDCDGSALAGDGSAP